MNKPIVSSLFALSFVTAFSAQAEEKIHKHPEPHPPSPAAMDRDAEPMEKVKVTFLGVETVPVGHTLAAQLGLPVDTGLVVGRVMEASPAESVLKEHDILTKFDDQLLIDTHQLSVLVRARREGEEVPVTLYRTGKEIIAKVKLGQREIPKHPRLDGLPTDAEHGLGFFNEEFPGPGNMRFHRFPGMEPDDVHNVLRMIGRERRNWFGAPPVHFFKRKNHDGSTMLNLAEGNFVFSDDAGSVEVQANEGKRELTVKNHKGETTFHGPINNREEREKLPPEVAARLGKIEMSELNDEPGEDFEQEMAVEPPGKTKISQPLKFEKRRAGAPPPPPF